jgi:hypothetical protein
LEKVLWLFLALFSPLELVHGCLAMLFRLLPPLEMWQSLPQLWAPLELRNRLLAIAKLVGWQEKHFRELSDRGVGGFAIVDEGFSLCWWVFEDVGDFFDGCCAISCGLPRSAGSTSSSL